VLYLGQLAAEGPATDFDPQSVVEIMTTGRSSRNGNGSEPAVSRGMNGLEG
jgi:hypothetical protein